MGFAPKEIDDMSVFEYIACCEGYRLSQGGEEAPADPMSLERMEELGII